MTVHIDTLFVMLDEEQPTEVQEAALREARKIKSLSVFMQPIGYQRAWGIFDHGEAGKNGASVFGACCWLSGKAGASAKR